MYAIGTRVSVIHASDETAPKGAIGKAGRVVRVEPTGDVGQTPASPGIIVLLDGAKSPDLFWPEELAVPGVGL